MAYQKVYFMNVLSVGDKITWKHDGNIYSAEIAMTDMKEKHYGVYVKYDGIYFTPDLIDFDKVL